MTWKTRCPSFAAASGVAACRHLTAATTGSFALGASSAPSTSVLLPLSMGFALQEQRRHRSFRFYLNLDDPAETRRRVEEDLARIDQEHQRGTMMHLHALLNLALSCYQSQDYVGALEYAEYAHTKTREHNKNATLLYFTAKTCSRCALALAEEYEAHLREMAEKAAVSSTLAPPPSVVFSAERTIAKLREDAVRYDGIAQRLCNRPDKAFMRGWGSTSTGWSEDARGMDEAPDDFFGARWKERRKRPEHAAIRQYYQQQRGDWGGTGVPK
ncbi:hypothetical protein TraAM80_06284 [Trypanosoma rangeli]|uniref:Uncharacterized protein n=1 Tax=Trypanosoma rangeli TaxID=5698 RepID=A0A3R7K6K4_TRYRA|nr:uncharacterized protein TraAM80_06284 [Trypanosoma rangeli]RNF02584.1 hypothetical protein TraAM80_06284 [Trypanosoma rangeli]|eukprot:RNF02584.1 hypothetical protein TraAM80_06284 [Trypanosoma rangeli]